jgi:Flp pilus assembly protein TadD
VARRSSALILLAASAFVQGGCGRAPAKPAAPTFSKDVAPIVFAHCAPCHRPGQPVPFSLLQYDDVASRAGDIVHMTATRQMPPWLPDPSEPPLIGERRLSDSQIDTLKRWADVGAPEGNRADLPAVPAWPSGWALGTPDLVVTLESPYVLQPGGHDVYRNVIMPLVVQARGFVRAVEFNPGTRAVHHAVLRVDRTGTARRLDREDPLPGFDGMVADVQDPDGHFIGWAPGRGPIVSPEQMAWPIDRQADLVVELHLMPGTVPTDVKPTIALYFTDTPPTRQPVMLIMGSKSIDIAPGDPAYQVEDRYQLPVAVDVLSLYPHAHYLGKEMTVEALLPGGGVGRLLHIPQWNFQWQQDYRFTTPVSLAAGTTIAMRYTYDNSESNTANPHRPVRRVTWGPHSSNEMGTLGLQVLPHSPADAPRLVASFAAHAAQRDIEGAELLLRVEPDSPANEARVGASYVRAGRYAEAIPHLQRALRLGGPPSASTENYLGGALLAVGRVADGITHLRRATTLEPRDAHLRFNLARALALQGDHRTAAAELRQALAIDPDFSEAHQELGVLLFEAQRLTEAIEHLEAAARLAPESSIAHASLGGALAQAGRRDDAIQHLRRALALDPSNSAARENLARLGAR